jgi:Fe-S-cluster containining protein
MGMKRINDKTCSKCEGACCKKMPGILHPKDVLDIGELLRSGDYAVDWWEGDPRKNKDDMEECYFIRPRVKDAETIFDPSWGGECVFLSENGCRLSFKDRPFGCRNLLPKKNDTGECRDAAGREKREYAMLWIKYQDEIEKFYDYDGRATGNWTPIFDMCSFGF